MAKLKVYSVFDSKIQTFAKPFFQLTRGEALRTWEQFANENREDSMVSKHPGDFALFELGEYDESSGSFENLSPPLNLGLAVQFKKPIPDSGNLFDMKKGVN